MRFSLRLVRAAVLLAAVPLLAPIQVLAQATVLAQASASGAPAVAAPPALERQRELVRLVRQDCGSCHGLSLAGGLGPALLPSTLADKPVHSLVETVLEGRPGSAMPGWRRFMNGDEAEWVVSELMRGFPELTSEGHR